MWNDSLDEEQIRSTLRDLAAQGVMQPYVHPRPGLMTPYLSAEWFKLWNVALDEARKLGMKLWIYDENSYPSGFAGGWVPELMPESGGVGIAMVESGAEGPFAFLLRREPFPLYPLLRGTGWTCSIRKEPTAFVFTVTRDPGFLR